MDTLNFKLKVEDLSEEITNLLNEESINQLAKDVGFTQRVSGKIDGFKFLDMLLFTHFNHKELSLDNMAYQLYQRYGIDIGKQSIHERFSKISVLFFKSIFEKALKITIAKDIKIDFTSFERVRIKDSTSFKLPDNMIDKYPNSNGCAKTAIIRIQFEYDLKRGEILDLSLHPFKEQDMIDASKTIDNIEANELLIRDLGYIKIECLKKTELRNAFYLNRLPFNTNAYEKKNGKFILINFGKLLKYMRDSNLFCIEKEVYIGKEEKFKTRIIIERLPDDEYEKRLRKKTKEAKKKQRTLSDKYKAQIGLNLFITNTEILAEDIRLLYTLRWQIELMFKIWKSIVEIDKVKKMKVERFETFLFAKLIWLVINWQIMRQIMIYLFNEKKIDISPYKLYKTFKMSIMEFRKAIISGLKNVIIFIEEMLKISPRFHKSDKKKDTKTWFYDVINMF